MKKVSEKELIKRKKRLKNDNQGNCYQELEAVVTDFKN